MTEFARFRGGESSAWETAAAELGRMGYTYRRIATEAEIEAGKAEVSFDHEGEEQLTIEEDNRDRVAVFAEQIEAWELDSAARKIEYHR